jgi:hypothetical protein
MYDISYEDIGVITGPLSRGRSSFRMFIVFASTVCGDAEKQQLLKLSQLEITSNKKFPDDIGT